jgi:hypothetical protein
LDHLLGKSSDDATSSAPDAEWLKIDTIVLSWIFITLSPTLQQRLVNEDPQTAKEAWDMLASIFNDNKRSRSIALKAELRTIKLGDLSIDAYFWKIENMATILSSLGSPISNDDIVTFALEGLPAKYDSVSTIIAHREVFPDLKMVRSMLTTEEMRLKTRAQDAIVDSTSSSPMVLVANSILNSRRSINPNEKVYKPCFLFAQGSCRFGIHCMFLHNGTHGNPSAKPTVSSITSNTLSPIELVTLQNLLAKMGTNHGVNSGVPQTATNLQPTGSQPLACYAAPPGFYSTPAYNYSQTQIQDTNVGRIL